LVKSSNWKEPSKFDDIENDEREGEGALETAGKRGSLRAS
jgi:hypothetical protein